MKIDTNIQNAKQKDNAKCYYPMLVSSGKGIINSGDAVVLRWKKFKTLPEKSREILLSEEVPRAIKNISDSLKLAPQQTEEISRLVRDVFFGNIKQEKIVRELTQKIRISEQQAQDIAREIKNKIFLLSPQKHSLSEQNTAIVKLPILEALKKYPELGRQRISANNIKLKIFPDPVKPSIKNWIADYRQTMGTENYGAIEKSNYLFHGENAKKLNSQELQKLSLVLKSMDSHIPLAINAKEQRVIFPLLETSGEAPRSLSARLAKATAKRAEQAGKHYAVSRKPEVKTPEAARPAIKNNRQAMPNSQTAKQPNKNDAGNFRFSSPQILESEKEKKDKNKDKDSRYYQIYPMGISRNGEKEKSKPRTKGNIVNLREDF